MKDREVAFRCHTCRPLCLWNLVRVNVPPVHGCDCFVGLGATIRLDGTLVFQRGQEGRYDSIFIYGGLQLFAVSQLWSSSQTTTRFFDDRPARGSLLSLKHPRPTPLMHVFRHNDHTSNAGFVKNTSCTAAGSMPILCVSSAISHLHVAEVLRYGVSECGFRDSGLLTYVKLIFLCVFL